VALNLKIIEKIKNIAARSAAAEIAHCPLSIVHSAITQMPNLVLEREIASWT
jgi:hypothetical protein